MNNQTTELLEKLAEKLGTTSEYLWGILVKQAPIDATIILIQTVFLFFIGWVLWKVHKKLSNEISKESSQTYYEKYEELAATPMILLFIGWGLMMIICFCYFGTIINGYFNPEYWALREILNALQSNCD